MTSPRSRAAWPQPSRSRRGLELIHAVVQSIPSGWVATYGQVAELAGLPGHARQVGYALRVLPEDSGVPWHRVVNARGEIRRGGERTVSEASADVTEQRALLEEEGVVFDRRGRVDLARHRWEE